MALAVVVRLLNNGATTPSLLDGKDWIVSTLLAVGIILLVVIPAILRAGEPIGRWTVQPLISAHDNSEHAHSEIRQAVALLQQAVSMQQREIDRNEQVRRESIRAVQDQLRIVIEMLERE